MKRLGVASLLLLGLAVPRLAGAQYAGGLYQFLMEEKYLKQVDFEAWLDGQAAAGQLTFTDQAPISDFDVEDPKPGESPPELWVRADLDSMAVEKNRALMGGTVVDSSHWSYLGKWVQLVVEDNETNPEFPDRLTWMFCQPRREGWVPSDAELPFDDGAYLSWWATDAERKDDVGIPSPDLLGKEVSCPVRPLWLYTFADLLRWDGDIVVRH